MRLIRREMDRPQSTGSTANPLQTKGHERGDRKRALAAVFLRDVAPTGRQCPVRSSFDPRVQILDPAIEVLFVGLPRHPVDAGGGVTLHRVDVSMARSDMVQERAEPLPFPLPCSLPYAFQ